MPLNYNKWDALELSDDSDIEVSLLGGHYRRSFNGTDCVSPPTGSSQRRQKVNDSMETT